MSNGGKPNLTPNFGSRCGSSVVAHNCGGAHPTPLSWNQSQRTREHIPGGTREHIPGIGTNHRGLESMFGVGTSTTDAVERAGRVEGAGREEVGAEA
eukprot:9341578-Pyramimonas_sp.AAC.1